MGRIRNIMLIICVVTSLQSKLCSQNLTIKNSYQQAIDSSSSGHSELIADSDIKYGRLALVGGALLSGMITIHIYQQNGWWQNNRAPFHFRENLVYGLNVDKIGHFYGGSLLTSLIGKSIEWANVPEASALLWGAGGSLLFQTYIEVEDGFSTWGFDRVDFASDVAGAAWPVAQH